MGDRAMMAQYNHLPMCSVVILSGCMDDSNGF
jgi:hypothetical protein